MDTSNKVIEAENKKVFMLLNAQKKLSTIRYFVFVISWNTLVSI